MKKLIGLSLAILLPHIAYASSEYSEADCALFGQEVMKFADARADAINGIGEMPRSGQLRKEAKSAPFAGDSTDALLLESDITIAISSIEFELAAMSATDRGLNLINIAKQFRALCLEGKL